MKSIACKAFQLDESEVQTWDYFNRKKHFTEPLDEDLDRTVSKANLLDKQDVLIQEKVAHFALSSLYLRQWSPEYAVSVHLLYGLHCNLQNLWAQEEDNAKRKENYQSANYLLIAPLIREDLLQGKQEFGGQR